MLRERATLAPDLPHRFDEDGHGACGVCGRRMLDARHVAWEKAAVALPGAPFVRETGS